MQFALGIQELPDDDPLIELMKRSAEEDGKSEEDVLLWESTRGWEGSRCRTGAMRWGTQSSRPTKWWLPKPPQRGTGGVEC
jgi:hypothetical protein